MRASARFGEIVTAQAKIDGVDGETPSVFFHLARAERKEIMKKVFTIFQNKRNGFRGSRTVPDYNVVNPYCLRIQELVEKICHQCKGYVFF